MTSAKHSTTAHGHAENSPTTHPAQQAARSQWHTTLQQHPPPLTNNQPPNNQLFHNLFENNQPRTSTMIQTPYTGASPTAPADLVEGIRQIVNQVMNSNKWDDTSKQMMKNIKIFDGSNKAECINWISQVEAAAKSTNTPFSRINLPEYGTHYVTHIFRTISNGH